VAPNDRHIPPALRARCAPHPADRRVAELAVLADAQHGRVHRAQLEALGFSSSAIGRLVERGWLRREHAGVFAVGHRDRALRGRWMAAVLAGWPDAPLGHRAAAALHGVRRPLAGIDVLAPTRRRSRDGVRFHRVVLPEDERDVVDGIPVTSILRTLLDLAAAEGRQATERAALARPCGPWSTRRPRAQATAGAPSPATATPAPPRRGA
jgi:predicted transcriptional regulator of viral defense system